MDKKTMTGAIIAAAVGALFISGQVKADETKKETTKVKCAGVNSCSGKGACGSDSNACAGENGCKGKGWVMMDPEQCKKEGGTIVEKKS